MLSENFFGTLVFCDLLLIYYRYITVGLGDTDLPVHSSPGSPHIGPWMRHEAVPWAGACRVYSTVDGVITYFAAPRQLLSFPMQLHK